MRVLASGKTTRVSLPQRISRCISIYSHRLQGRNGIEFRPDVYGRDRKLYTALFGKLVVLGFHQRAQGRKCRQGFLAGFDVQHGGAVMGQEFLDLRVDVIAQGNGGGKHAE